MKFGPNWGKND